MVGSRDPVAVLGAGAWGTTLSILLGRAGRSVRLWTHRAEHASALRAEGRNRRYLPGQVLPAEIQPTSRIGEAVDGAAFVLLVVPSAAVRATASVLVGHVPPEAIVVNCAKGLEPATHRRLSVVIAEALPEAAGRVAVLSGPNLAGEIVTGLPASAVVAAAEIGVAATARDGLMTPTLRLYSSGDMVGVELAGALKNVIALGAGISDGLGLGDNAKAAFITRGLAEISRLGVAAGAHPLTFTGLAGVGDLIATCSSRLSRNHTVGERLARGQTLRQIMDELGHVAEGVTTTQAALSLAAELGVELPITEQLAQVLFHGKPVAAAIQALLARDARHERDDPPPLAAC